MPTDFNQQKQLSIPLYEMLCEWITDYCKFQPEAYDDDGKLKAIFVSIGIGYLIDSKVFDNADEIKLEFGKQYHAILPDFIFEAGGAL